MQRSPIVSVLGHVDHGKSSLLDAIRETDVTAAEAGDITQAIGASIVPIDAIKHICGDLLERLDLDFTIPGLLFIDTPGHAAFTSLRERGGVLADIAVLVVDITEGFKPQTFEALEILRNTQTPFIIVANKLDLIPGYEHKHDTLLKDITAQSDSVQSRIDEALYEIVGEIHDAEGIVAERFDKVDDYAENVAIVPASAKERYGVAETLMVITGLAQRYLSDNLEVDVQGKAKGSVLEVKEEEGMGATADVILYDGTLHVDDTIVVGGVNGPVVTEVRALVQPAPMSEMRDIGAKFDRVDQVSAATGVKISAPDLDDVQAGMPLVATDDVAAARADIQEQIDSVVRETGERGVVVKADSIGSLEALLQILDEEEIPVARATVGEITNKDVAAAKSSAEHDPLHCVILGFNVDQIEAGVKVLTSDVVYQLLEDLRAWQESYKEQMEVEKLQGLTRPFKVRLLPGYTFRQSNPAVVGVEVLDGLVTTGSQVMRDDGTTVGTVKSIQDDQENVSQAEAGMRVAISISGATVGRQVEERDVLYSQLDDDEFRKLKDLSDYLRDDEVEVMKEVAKMMRADNPVWGV